MKGLRGNYYCYPSHPSLPSDLFPLVCPVAPSASRHCHSWVPVSGPLPSLCRLTFFFHNVSQTPQHLLCLLRLLYPAGSGTTKPEQARIHPRHRSSGKHTEERPQGGGTVLSLQGGSQGQNPAFSLVTESSKSQKPLEFVLGCVSISHLGLPTLEEKTGFIFLGLVFVLHPLQFLPQSCEGPSCRPVSWVYSLYLRNNTVSLYSTQAGFLGSQCCLLATISMSLGKLPHSSDALMSLLRDTK